MALPRLLKLGWTLSVIVMGAVLIVLTFVDPAPGFEPIGGSVAAGVLIGILAFLAEYVDSSLGMGYGTTLTPILMILGFSPLEVVPSVLLSEFVSGLAAGTLHHRLGNVDLLHGERARRTLCILTLCSLVGTVLAVVLALRLPKRWVKTYIGVMITGIGLFILLGRRTHARFSWKKVLALGSIASFNKGLSGGGYGPLVTGGQILSGVPEKQAVGITSMAEGLICCVGLILYVLTRGFPPWHLALPLTLGAVLSVPAATWTVKLLPERVLQRFIGYATLLLGTLTLLKVWI